MFIFVSHSFIGCNVCVRTFFSCGCHILRPISLSFILSLSVCVCALTILFCPHYYYCCSFFRESDFIRAVPEPLFGYCCKMMMIGSSVLIMRMASIWYVIALSSSNLKGHDSLIGLLLEIFSTVKTTRIVCRCCFLTLQSHIHFN